MNNAYQRNYMPNYNQNAYEENLCSQIDNQINNLVGMRNQLRNAQQQNQQPQQPTAINQTFQLSPNGGNGIKYADSIEDVNKETVFYDTPFFSKDLSVVWLKNSSGDIKAYELNEIVQKDEKDMQIELLQAQVDELKGMISNEQSYTNAVQSKDETVTAGIDETVGSTTKKSKSPSVSRVSTSKKK